jgi:hypothetical protein
MNTTSNDLFFDLFQSLAPASVMFFIIGIVAFAISIAYTIRLWLVQTATLQMQEDLRDIKNYLLSNQEVTNQPQSSDDEVYVSDEEKKAILAENYRKMKPRRAYVWLAAAIPALLIVLMIVQNNH